MMTKCSNGHLLVRQLFVPVVTVTMETRHVDTVLVPSSDG